MTLMTTAMAEIESDGVIVGRMVTGRHELLIGVRVDTVFGPVVIAGEGGRHVEAVDRFAVLTPPFSPADMLSTLERLPRAAVWKGRRGEPRTELGAFAELASRVGDLALRLEGVASIDLNPVLVGVDGEGVLIADALIERSLKEVNASDENQTH